MASFILAGVGLALVAGHLGAQGPEIRLGVPVNISTDSAVRHAETVIAINPRDQRNLIAAVIELRAPRTNTALYASHDGGRTWRRAVGPDGLAVADSTDDPAVAFSDSGQAFFTARGEPLRVRQSRDGGLTWDAGAILPGRGHDRPWLAVDRATRRLYAVSKIVVAVLGGDSPDLMAASRSLSAVGPTTPLAFEGPRLIFVRPPGPHWWLYVPSSFINGPGNTTLGAAVECDMPEPSARTIKCRFVALPATNGGWRFEGPRLISEMTLSSGAAQPWLSARSAPGGRLAVDNSNGPSRGRVHAAWVSIVNGRGKLFTAFSSDTGRTWSAPVAVAGDSTSAHQANPEIAVNRDGTVGIAWNDWRGNASGDCFRPYFATSTDGGRTYSHDVPLTVEYACSVTPGGLPEPERFANGGDTFGLVAAADGAFHAAWVGGPRWKFMMTRIEVIRRDLPLPRQPPQ